MAENPPDARDGTDRDDAEPAETGSDSPPVPGVPSDNVTIHELIASLDEAGYDGQFTPIDSNHLQCSRCENTVRATDLDVTLARRVEGASDPDDMATLFAARCPACQGGGTVMVGYGVNASELDGDISRQLHGLAPS